VSCARAGWPQVAVARIADRNERVALRNIVGRMPLGRGGRKRGGVFRGHDGDWGCRWGSGWMVFMVQC
jgi:hypothetical protein